MEIDKLYALDNSKGVTTVTELRKDIYLKRRGEFSYHPTVLIDPELNITEAGILEITGMAHEYELVDSNTDTWNWNDKPTSELNDNWKDLIFFEEENLIKKDIVTWVGWFIFKKRNVVKDVEHLKAGRYLKKKGYKEDIKVSNFKIKE